MRGFRFQSCLRLKTGRPVADIEAPCRTREKNLRYPGEFWSGIRHGFRGNYGSVWTYLLFQFQMSKKEREMCEFETNLRIFFVFSLI